MKYLFKRKQIEKPVECEIFYVRGYQRSGTNWLSNLLNLHPEINCSGEFHMQHFFSAKKAYFSRKFYSNEINEEIEKSFYNFTDNCIKNVCKYHLKCGDRTPTSLESTYTPGRKNILITRDGRDCIVSWVYHCLRKQIITNKMLKNHNTLFLNDNNYFEYNKSELLSSEKFIKNLSRQWNKRILEDYTTVQNAKKNQIDMPVYWLKYEDLILETELKRKELYKFLGVNSDKAQRLDELTTPGFNGHNPKNHNRIGIAGRWKEYFTEEQLHWFNEVAKDALELINLKDWD